MNQKRAKKELIEQLKLRMGEVAEHRAYRWLDELDRSSRRSAKQRIEDRIEEVTDKLANKWLRELEARSGWIRYRKGHDGFCYGIGFGECEDCEPQEDYEACPSYAHCKEEYECSFKED